MHVPQTEIVLWHDGAELARVSLSPGEYIIGRNPEAHVRADTLLLSRQHARLIVKYDHVLIEDLGSSNGTYVDERPIAETTRLFPYQPVRLGDVRVEITRLPTELGDGNLLTAQAAIRALVPADTVSGRRYAVGQSVARGGMGAILEARQRAMERRVAMKVMLERSGPAEVARFVDEARITGQLEHPNIVPIHELGVDDDDQLFYTMKFVHGVTLKKVLVQISEGDPAMVKRYPLPALLTVFQKACDAVAFAHSRGVIHRDLKPDNIMLGDFGEVLVMDWGLAKLLGVKEGVLHAPKTVIASARDSDFSFEKTMAGAVLGTPIYMAPEQARGEVDSLDTRADVYALGAILFEILTLRPPIKGRVAAEVVDKVGRGETIPFREAIASGGSRLVHLPGGRAPESLEAIVRHAMALRREDRYRSVEALQADLTAYQNGFATSAERAGAWKQFKLFVRRNRGVSIAAVAGFVVLAGVSAAFTWRVVDERNVAVAERKSAEDARRTAEIEKARASSALAQTETERQRAERALVDTRAEQQRANAERARADAESDRAKKALGDVRTESNRAEAALADLKKTAPTFLALARARLAEGKYAEAFEQIGYALRLDEQGADYILFRADAYQTLRRLPEAMADYRRVLELRPGDKTATSGLAICHRLQDEVRSAPLGSMVRLVGWWKGDGNALDWVGMNHGTAMNGLTFAEGRVGQAFSLDGKAAHVSIPASPSFGFDGEFTIALWVNFAEMFGQQAFLATEGKSNKWVFQFVPGRLQLIVPGKTLESAYFGPALAQWYHVAIVQSSGRVRFYINGAELSSEAWTGSLPVTGAPLILGHAAGRFYFSGQLDDVRLYARGLEPAEVRELAGLPR